jgi:microcystin degradation protein MlrC
VVTTSKGSVREGRPRVAIAGFLHESNTFLRVPTGLEHFRSTSWTEGEAMLVRWSGALHEIGGMIDGCSAEGLDVVPLLATFAVPSGTVAAEAFEHIVTSIATALQAALPVDGLLLALHGATVAQGCLDADGELLQRLRAMVGPHVPLIATLDLHANISQAMVDATDAILCYRTNPHLDQRERGLEAATLMARTLRGEIRPVQALAAPPLVVAIDRQGTSVSPANQLYAEAAAAACEPGVLAASVAMGFYYADVREMGLSVVAVADGDRELATRTAHRIALAAWQSRHQFSSNLLPVAEAVRRAAASLRTPVGLFDVGDNVGGGSPGDSTVLLWELYGQRVPGCAAVLFDPEAVGKCVTAGVRSRVQLAVGGKTDDLHGSPLPIEGVVRTLSDGIFVEREVRHGGWGRGDQGITAVVEAADGTTVVLTSRRMAPMSLQQLLSVGVDVRAKRAVVVKGVVAPRAAYEPVCGEILLVDTPGVTAGDPRRFTYENRRRPLFPLEDCQWT